MCADAPENCAEHAYWYYHEYFGGGWCEEPGDDILPF